MGGWYGTAAIILAFVLSSFSILKPTDFIYQILNFTGAIGIMVVSLVKRVYQVAVINIVWMIVALIALTKILLKILAGIFQSSFSFRSAIISAGVNILPPPRWK